MVKIYWFKEVDWWRLCTIRSDVLRFVQTKELLSEGTENQEL